MRSKERVSGIAFPGLKIKTWGAQSSAEEGSRDR
jgi:hypothetical protein